MTRQIHLWMLTAMLSCAPTAVWAAKATSRATSKPALKRPMLLQIDATTRNYFRRGSFPGMSVGIVVGDKLVWSKHMGFADIANKRKANDETLYRIGSINKVFTTSLLIQARDAGKLRLDDPVAKYLPKGTKLPTDPRGAKAITMRHLATHTSGLPSLPPNLKPVPGDPYHHFSRKALYQGLGSMTLDAPIGARYGYSNTGMALLGLALARLHNTTYATLLQQKLLKPLGMKAGIALTPARKKRLAVGYGPTNAPRKSWHLGAFAPAGGLLMSLRDLGKWVAYQHRAGTAMQGVLKGPSLREMHTVQRMLPQRKVGTFAGGIGLGWHVLPLKSQRGTLVFHNGAVAGFRSFAGFSPEYKVGVVVLTNSDRNPDNLGFQLVNVMAKAAPKKQGYKPSPRLRSVLGKLCSHITAKPKQTELVKLFAPLFLQHVPGRKLTLMMANIYSQMGTCKQIAWQPTRRKRIGVARVTFSKGRRLNVILGLSPSIKGRLIMLQLRPAK